MSGRKLYPPNKLGRRQHDMLIDLGYEALGMQGGGHFRYRHAVHDDVILSGTSYDRTAWQMFLSMLRKRHPERFVQRRAEREQTKPITTTRRRQTQRARVLRVVADAEMHQRPQEQPERLPDVDRIQCVDCGRPWLSDLDHTTRPCPQCGGQIISPRRAA